MSSGPSGIVRRRPTSWSSSRRWARLAGGVLLVGSLVVTVPLVPHGARAEAPAPGGTGSEVDQALAQAADTGQPVIIESATTADVIEYAQPNGTIITQLSAGPVRAPDPGTPGRWVPIDTTLVSDAAAIHPRVADAEITLSAGGAGQLASVTSNGITTAMGWPASLPEPSLTGSTATYANAVDDADLILTALPDGYEVSLILRHAPAEPLTLDLPLATGGLMPSMVNGRLSLADASGAEIVSADPAVMFDSSMDEVGEPKRLGPVSTQLVSTQDGYSLNLTPDAKFFATPGLLFPVTLDPTSSYSVSTDTHVRSDMATTSYGTSTVLKIGTPDGAAVTRSLIRFAGTSGLLYKQIDSATLSLYENYAPNCTHTGFDVYSVLDPFTNSTTWDNQPTVGTIFAAGSDAKGATGCSAGVVTDELGRHRRADARGSRAGLGVRLGQQWPHGPRFE